MTNTTRNALSSITQWAAHAGPRKAFALSALLAIAIGFALYNYYLAPMREANWIQAQQLAQLHSQNVANHKILDTMPMFIAGVNRAEQDYAVARTFLPDAPEVSVVLSGVQKLARTRGVSIIIFRDTGSGAKSPLADKLNERSVPIQIVGQHLAVARFLAALASYPRVLHVRDLAITSGRRDESVDATLVCYYAPSPQDLPQLRPELQTQALKSPGGFTH